MGFPPPACEPDPQCCLTLRSLIPCKSWICSSRSEFYKIRPSCYSRADGLPYTFNHCRSGIERPEAHRPWGVPVFHYPRVGGFGGGNPGCVRRD
eukprot:4135489-Amphidinium_carterae.1